MARYSIIAAKPKGETNHCNSQFLTYKESEKPLEWNEHGWLSINAVSDLLRAGNQVLTGAIENGKLTVGEAVEVELRIVKNGAKFKISTMPDKAP